MTTESVRVAAIIPARMASSRFPGKPLLPVLGLPMVEHVRRRALLSRCFSEVVVATCDPQIAHVIEGYGGRCLMTSPSHPGATDRVAEAMQQLECTHVVNVQGDEILVLPEDVARMVGAMTDEPEAPAWNAVAPLECPEELGDRAIVKCALSAAGAVMFCSRDFSHLAAHLQPDCEPIQKILGILGYRRDFLERYLRLPRTPLEMAEGIDQSRIIEHGIMLKGVRFSRGYPGINEPREVAVVEAYLSQDAHQRLAVGTVLDAP